MKKLVLLVCLFLIPLTLVSETQHRFRIAVHVFIGKHGDVHDTYVKDFLETRLKKELHILGDVDVVELAEGWHFALEITYFQHTLTDGRKTGWISIADGFYEGIPHSYFKVDRYHDLRGIPIYLGGFSGLGVSLYQRDELNQYCVKRVEAIDKTVLTPIRELLR